MMKPLPLEEIVQSLGMSLPSLEDLRTVEGAYRLFTRRSRIWSPKEIRIWRECLERWLDDQEIPNVTIPFGKDLAEHTNPYYVRIRRLFGIVLTFIKAHALLYAEHRERDDEGQIIATLDDYRAVYALAEPTIREIVRSTIPDRVKQVADLVYKLTEGGRFAVNELELSQFLRISYWAASKRIQEAIHMDLIQSIDDEHNKPRRFIPGNAYDMPILPDPDILDPTFKGPRWAWPLGKDGSPNVNRPIELVKICRNAAGIPIAYMVSNPFYWPAEECQLLESYNEA